MDDARIQSTLLGWIISLAITVSVLLRRHKDLRQKLFVLFAGNVTLFYVFSFLFAWRGEPWFERIAFGLAVLIPQWGLRFFREFSSGSHGAGRLGGLAAVLGAILLAVILYPSPLRPALGPAVLAYVVGFMLVAIFNLNVQVKEATSRIEAARIRYLVIGGLLSVTFQVADRLDQIIDVEMPPVGLAMTLIYLYVISQSIMRYRIFDLYEMLGRFAVLSMMGISLAAIYTGLVSWADKAFSINAFLASLVILILFDPLRDLVERKITDFFFRERAQLEQEVAHLRRRLAHLIETEELVSVLIDGFSKSRRLTHAAIYLIDPQGTGFDLHGHIGPNPSLERIEAAQIRRHLRPVTEGKPLMASAVAQNRERLLQQNAANRAQREAETAELLAALQADVLLPIYGDEQLHGMLSFKDERLGDPFSPEDLVLLAGLAGQVAIAVENTRLYKQIKERDRLAALGQMAAGLAHEIRNPLGSIKGAAQFVEELSLSEDDPGPEGELLGVIVEEVDRLNRVLSDFLTYARPSSGSPRLQDVGKVLRRTLQVFEAGKYAALDLSVELAEDLPGVQVDAERLHQVFLNLLINAVQAMDDQENKRLEISTRLRTVRSLRHGADSSSGTDRFLEVRFLDNGPGIPPEVIDKLFIPFFTTKEKGSGLGLAVCQRIIRDAGGEIEVRSSPGQGASFTLVFPVAEEAV